MMLSRNGIGIGIDYFPYHKKPCLYVYDRKTNTCYKVASFNNEHSADFFKEAVKKMFEIREENDYVETD